MLATTEYIKTKLQAAIVAAYELTDADPMLMPASNPKFGDFQCNAPLGLAKKVGAPPREVAQRVIENLSLSDLCETPTIGGPGFINLTLKRDVLESMTLAAFADPRLSITTVSAPKRVVIDFSSPNVAKEMHVGHLRSTIIGDSIARILEFLGHDVLRINHIGDWGTQFGMLIAYLKAEFPEALTTSEALDLGDLVALYRKAKAKFDEDEIFKETARREVVALQSGDPVSRYAWELLCAQSRKAFDQIYEILNVKIIERGESFYNPLLPAVVTDLDALGLLTESEGAKCVFPEGFTTRDGDPLPVIIQKTDGGYNYDTTDLAAIQYRINEDHGDWLIYVTDAGQATHFAQVFAVARLAHWIPDNVRIDHVPFGLVLGEGGKKLKTRSGDTVRLIDLLDEAVDHARQDTEARLVQEERTETDEYKELIAKTLGIGAIKYADLSQNRISDYIFSYEKMLALQGNTAPYMIYAFVRVHGISRKGGIDFTQLGDALKLALTEESELTLAKHLLRLDEVLYAVSDDFLPSRLCQYLFELSQKFNRFYEACPVLIAEEPARTSRLALCDLTARSLKLGLELLGIQVVDRL